ncbi:MAG TPA: O-methyltransferase [Solirubrobacteraceae bacterium]|jgi:predicted O-methyltransferase YrrM|nr:O-methyltransferase [Solirubrobacteraceae bacterium]
MTQELWTAVDEHICRHLLDKDTALEAAAAAGESAGLPPIAVTPNQGKLLELLVRIHKSERVLELGTLGGYSTIWLARGVPAQGTVVTLELSPDYAAVARESIARAGLAARVDLRVGAALETLAAMHAAGEPPFDLIFIDADKQNYPGYLEWSLKLSRPGTVLIGDNVVRSGGILDTGSDDGVIQGVRRFYELLEAEPRVDATAVQTVGAKGHDGFALGIVLGAAR